jgi:hypothetical protein
MMKRCNFNIANNIIKETAGQKVSFDYVVKRYDVTPEQLKNDMKSLRWTNEGCKYYFDLNQIRAKYKVDTDKLSALAKLEAAKVQPEKGRRL